MNEARKALRNAERAYYRKPTDERFAALKSAEELAYPGSSASYQAWLAKQYEAQQWASCPTDCNDVSTVTHDPR